MSEQLEFVDYIKRINDDTEKERIDTDTVFGSGAWEAGIRLNGPVQTYTLQRIDHITASGIVFDWDSVEWPE